MNEFTENINDLLRESLSIKPFKIIKESFFENYLTSQEAKDILKNEVYNTCFDRYEIEEDGAIIRKVYLTQYIQVPFKYNEGNWEENKNVALKELANIYEKAIETKLLLIGCLGAGAFSLPLNDELGMVYICPASQYNWTPKEFNKKLNTKYFRNEGELGSNEEIDNL